MEWENSIHLLNLIYNSLPNEQLIGRRFIPFQLLILHHLPNFPSFINFSFYPSLTSLCNFKQRERESKLDIEDGFGFIDDREEEEGKYSNLLEQQEDNGGMDDDEIKDSGVLTLRVIFPQEFS